MEITEAVGRAYNTITGALGNEPASIENMAEHLFDMAQAVVGLLAPFCERAEDSDDEEDALDAELRRRPGPDDHRHSRGYV